MNEHRHKADSELTVRVNNGREILDNETCACGATRQRAIKLRPDGSPMEALTDWERTDDELSEATGC